MPSPTPTAVPTQSCIAPGASCYYDNDRCCKTNNIFYKCSGPWGDKKCIASVPTPTPGNPCLKLNNECTSSLECCNGRCEFYKWSTTQKRCCAAVGGDYCGSSPAGYGTPIDFGDCCDGSFCYGNRCYPNGFDTDTLWSLNNGKKIIGEPCTSDTDCLNNRCDNQRCQDFVSGVGSSNLNCVPSGSIMAAPVYPSRCCSGNANGNLCF